MNLQKESRFLHPKNIVHLCFAIVFLFLTLLTWHEAMVLKRTYESNQLARLSAVANNLDNQWQHNLDELAFFHSMLEHSLGDPLVTDRSTAFLQQFESVRHTPLWHLSPSDARGVPINGISDELLTHFPLFSRSDPQRLGDELNAVLEMSQILQFNQPERDFYYRFWYISRAGFYLSSTLPDASSNHSLENFSGVARRPYFVDLDPNVNPQRRIMWSGPYDSMDNEGKVVTVARPVDRDGYWFGVLAMDFSTQQIKQYLQQSLSTRQEGGVMLVGHQFNLIAWSDGSQLEEYHLHKAQLARLTEQAIGKNSGTMRFDGRFVSWVRLQYFDGMLVNVQTLREGLLGDSGRVGLVLLLTWLMFTIVVVISHQAIIRMTGSLLNLQEKLSWRANYDGLTRLLNRTAFFDRAESLAALNQRQQQPLSLIQLDLDHFKSVNDSWGHHAGDRVLAHAASVIGQALRKTDIAGRVGGEEFCILLPATRLDEAVLVAERIRSKLAAKELLVGKHQTLKVTASLGVSSSEEQGDYQVDNLQSIADRRLYLAKQGGRNCVRHRD